MDAMEHAKVSHHFCDGAPELPKEVAAAPATAPPDPVVVLLGDVSELPPPRPPPWCEMHVSAVTLVLFCQGVPMLSYALAMLSLASVVGLCVNRSDDYVAVCLLTVGNALNGIVSLWLMAAASQFIEVRDTYEQPAVSVPILQRRLFVPVVFVVLLGTILCLVGILWACVVAL